MAWSGTGIVRAVVVMVAVAILLVVLLLAFQRRLIYLPDRHPVPPAGDYFDDARDATLRTSDGLELAGWVDSPPAREEETAPKRDGPNQQAVTLTGMTR
jgi:hypothetical protein